jgi:hypothetical protein
MRVWLSLTAAVVLGFLCLQAVSAQQEPDKTRAAVVIRVTDPSTAAVAGAQVRIAPVPDNPAEKMETNEKGEHALSLQPGGYAFIVPVQ